MKRSKDQDNTEVLKIRLAEKTMDLKIEAALEKVRAVALRMKEPADMLKICKTISRQLARLGLREIRNVQTAIFDEPKGAYMNYEYYAKHDKSLVTETNYTNNRTHKAFALKMLRGKGEFFKAHIKGKKVKEWIAYQKTTNVFIDNYLNKASSLNYYWHSLGPVALGISTYEPLMEEELALFRRFLKVFELAYRRYLDIEKAVAQAREARIQLALEKVRARTMAMQNSNELPEAANLLFRQVQSLGIPAWSAGYCIWNEDKSAVTLWMSTEGVLQPPFTAPTTEDELFIQMRKGHQPGTPLHIVEMGGKKLEKHYRYMRKLPVVGEILDGVVKAGHPLPAFQIMHYAYFSAGFLLFITYEPVPEAHAIFIRFAKVFEQTYTRFLDLQKAEAQTKEAQIEASLERIRSRTMGMQKTEELKEIVALLYEECDKFGFASVLVILNTRRDEDDGFTWWFSANEQTILPQSYFIPDLDEPVLRDIKSIWESGKPCGYIQIGGNVKAEHDRRLFSETGLRELPDQLREMMRSYESVFISIANMKNGFIEVAANEFISGEQANILQRYANVFEQTYTRFLDLQKAEAQAREAEIELALERVRARTMSMHKSEELAETASVLFQQLIELGVKPVAFGFIIMDEKTKSGEVFISADGTVIPDSFVLPYHGEPAQDKIFSSWKKKEPYVIVDLKEKKLEAHLKFIAKNMPVFDMLEASGTTQPDRLALHMINFRHGCLGVNYPEPNEGVVPLLVRFAKVFEQTYTRFLDLQNAEAQARESEIQLALERVRARTMAMHKSEELQDVASLLYKEFQGLGVTSFLNCGYVEVDEEHKTQYGWMTSPDGTFMEKFHLPLTGELTFQARYDAWKKQEPVYRQVIGGAALVKHIKVASRHFRSVEVEKMVKSQFPDPTIFYCGNFSKGYLHLVTGNLLTSDEESLLERFTRAFEMTYKRFLDLQKAEAQAREAEIELALERVRARTMAMQKSDELREVVGEFFRQVQLLGIEIQMFVIFIFKPDGGMEWWGTEFSEKGLPQSYSIPSLEGVTNHSRAINLLEIRRNKTPYQVFELSGKEKKNWDQFLLEKTGLEQLPAYLKKGMRSLDKIVLCDSVCEHGILEVAGQVALSGEHENVLQRFSKVFEQTYTRFLDVQKAEIQARKAQIEAALERVRGRTMGMHRSEELKEVIQVVYEQMRYLDMLVEHAGFYVDYKTNDDMQIWLADPNHIPSKATLPYFESQTWNSFIDAKEKGIDFFTNLLGFEEKNKFYSDLFRLYEVPEETRDFYFSCPGLAVSTVLLDNVGLYIENFSGIPYTDEENAILMRFGKVFQQTYTRFLDLQKSEAQTKEAQIEAALERIRSKVTAMRESLDLQDIVVAMRKEFVALGHEAHYFWYMRWLPDKYQKAMTSGDGARIGMVMELPRHIHGDIPLLSDWEKSEKPAVVYAMDVEAAVAYVDKMIRLGDFTQVDPHAPTLEDIRHIGGLTFIMARTLHGEIGYSLPGVVPHPPEEAVNTLNRFAAVFDLAYRRFEDLKGAEKRNRETQIELALEKVRSRTMAMRKSSELIETAELLFDQLKQLGAELQGVAFSICDENSEMVQKWSSIGVFSVPYTIEPGEQRMYEAWKNKEEIYEEIFEGERQKKYYELFMEIPAFREGLQKFIASGHPIPPWQKNHAVIFRYGYLLCITTKPFEETQIFIRFAKVFEQTYTRFLDLQKAEAQAMEAKIEASLEKVRGKAMAMHNTNDLSETIHVFYSELQAFSITPRRCGVGLLNKKNKEGEVFTWNTTEEGDSLELVGKLNLEAHPVLENIYNGWLSQTDYFPVLRGNEIKEYNKVLRPMMAFPDYNHDTVQYGYFFFFEEGGVYAWTEKEMQEDELKIYRRFTSVLSLTYKRYKDLKEAEAQARESEIQLALERVRARSLAMHHTSELQEVVNIVAQQLHHMDMDINGGVFIAINDEAGQDLYLWASGGAADYVQKVRVPFLDEPAFTLLRDAIKRKNNFFTQAHDDDEKARLFQHLFHFPPWNGLSDQRKQEILSRKGGYTRSVAVSNFTSISITNHNGKKFSHEDNEILKRFGHVFEQAYTRFLDLQKAEAQAIEAQIEVALERVRARAMAMHKSDELSDAAILLYKELRSLGISQYMVCGYVVIDEEEKKQHGFMSTFEGTAMDKFTLPLMGEPAFDDRYENWKKQVPAFHQSLGGVHLRKHLQFASPHFGSEKVDEIVRTQFKDPTIFYCFNFSSGYLHIISDTLLSPENEALAVRFTKVLELTYKRFIDLQKAEAQAREAQIEVSLERVRSSSMAMHQSSDLHEVIKVITEQLCSLQLKFDVANFAKVDEAGNWEMWLSTPAQSYPARLFVPYLDHPIFNRVLEMRRDGLDHIADLYDQESKNIFFRHFFGHSEAKHSPESRQEAVLNRKGFSRTLFYLKNIWFAISNYEGIPFSDPDTEIFRRFAKAFEQSYIRFLDLQKAEAQAREAQIEVALERLRNQSMLMQHSEEINSISNAFHEQLVHLGIPSEFSYLWLPNIENKEHQFWASWVELGSGKEVLKNKQVTYPLDENESYTATCLHAWNKQDVILEEFVPPVAVAGFFEAWPDLIAGAQHLKAEWFPEGLYYVEAYMKYGCFGINIRRAMTVEEKQILRRFAIEFERSYTRFQDLKKAETQARESQIELGLEKVRSQAMAMQKSDELKALIGSVFTELTRLDLLLTRCLIMIYDPNSKGSMWWMANSESPSEPIGLYVKYHKQAPYLAYIKAWENRTLKWQFILDGKIKTAWDDFLFTETELAHLPDFVIAGMKAPDRVFLNASFNNFGNLTLASLEPLSDEHFEIMLRFAKVFDLTYTRFNDLQRAEASAREAVKQASLDRVRAEIASMRTPADLERITPLLWKELTVLGLPFIRCGVFIMDESSEQIHTYLSTPEGSSIAAFDIPYHTPGNIRLVLNQWKENKSYTDRWDEEDFREFANTLVSAGALSSPDRYLSTLPPGGVFLHFLPFQQGMLYIGSLQSLGEDALRLVQSVAEAFSTAYSRYEDFNRLEAAKQQVDQALVDLKLAQSQLVQAEKMASLGELTAGIAHEIQNPLNFVNNFAEVNFELIDEVNQAIQSGNLTEIPYLTENIKQNLEKINYHGKRADGIVKSMLQHSRSNEPGGKNIKEPTDINAMADEYLRLAYHGLRAKDKTFNAAFMLDLDPDLGNIKVIPQDMGRVLLNLINNAFWAVTEKQNQNGAQHPDGQNYKPTVILKTRKLNGLMELKVTDNGNGIPQKLLDKIFQPFFTTKPTGQGTGLGLSLSYDIIKAHGGDLRVETKEGEGSSFIISLPNT